MEREIAFLLRLLRRCSIRASSGASLPTRSHTTLASYTIRHLGLASSSAILLSLIEQRYGYTQKHRPKVLRTSSYFVTCFRTFCTSLKGKCGRTQRDLDSEVPKGGRECGGLEQQRGLWTTSSFDLHFGGRPLSGATAWCLWDVVALCWRFRQCVWDSRRRGADDSGVRGVA